MGWKTVDVTVSAVEGKVCGPVDAAVGKDANIAVGLQSAASAPLSPRASGAFPGKHRDATMHTDVQWMRRRNLGPFGAFSAACI